MNRTIILAAVLLTVTPVLASAQVVARPAVVPQATLQVQRNVLVLPTQQHTDVLRDLQTIIDAQPGPGMSAQEVRFMTELSQWAVAQRNRLRYADLVRSMPRSRVSTRQLEHANETLRTIGDDAQLANLDLQSILQRQQQTMQTMSSVSRTLHDTALSVIRKMGG